MSTFSRRSFLTALSGGLLLAPVLSRAQTHNKDLKIKFLCPRWGAKDPWDAFCKRVKDAGYDGVETPAPKNPVERQEFLAALEKHNLDLVLMALPGPSDFEQHKRVYETILLDCVSLKPLFINAHTGKDFFTFDQNKQLIDLAANVAEASGVKIIHETHRGKFSFAAHVTQKFLEELPDLRLTLDISHWCSVASSLLGNQKEAVTSAINRADHIHARIGYQHGPQVNDPRAPEWKRQLNAHLQWWDRIVAMHRENGSPVLTVTPEFGPPNYMPTEPYSSKPLSDQWGVNVHMMKLLRERYS